MFWRKGLPVTQVLACALGLCLTSFAGAQPADALQGKVVDESGAVIVQAQVSLTDGSGKIQKTVTDERGSFRFLHLAEGLYTLEVEVPGFAPYQNFIQIGPDSPTLQLEVRLSVAGQREELVVESESPLLDLAPDQNAGALILRGEDLEALPEDPDELAEALQALAGPAAGPNGGQFYVDGFTGGRLPPRASIREIRINQNPFSAEFERIGFGRVEIFTRPGTEKFRGQMHFNFNDESLNSRNPFAPNRPPFQARQYGGNFGGPLVTGKASFFVDFERREIDENAVISARVLDDRLQEVPFRLALVTPQRRTTVSPRLDYQLSTNHTLVGRYSFSRNQRLDEGIGEFSLPSRSYDARQSEHELRLTETAILSPRVINETRLSLEWSKNLRQGDTSLPSINVLDAFFGGGSQVGLSFDEQDRVELFNATSWTSGAHALKAGVQVNWIDQTDVSRSNFGGTFTFGGGLAPLLGADHQVVRGEDGQPILTPITSLERYRRTLLFQQMGLSPQQIRALGGGATQFSLAAGNPQAAVTQTELAVFLQDDWRLRPNFLLSLGLRYEAQTNLDDRLNVAPRLGFAWSPGAAPGSRPRTVIRGGFGLFFDRFGHQLTLQANRFNGVNQQQFVVPNPDFFPAIPSLEMLQASARPQTVRRIGAEVRSPYSMQAAISVERQLPGGFTLSTSYVRVRTVHLLRSLSHPAGQGFPLAGISRIYEFVSDGRADQNQLIVGLNNRFNRNFTLFSNYSFGKANSDSDGAGTFPADPLDLRSEYGRSSFDVRHRVVVGGSVRLPWELRLNPFIIASTGRPFNITTGRDNNGDTIFSDRPALTTDLSKPGVVLTPYGAFDPNPDPGQPLIPRNFGEGPGFFNVNLRIGRTFGFGSVEASEPSAGGEGPPPGRWAGGRYDGGRRGGGRGTFGSWGDSSSGHRYSLSFSIQVQNLLNHTNFGPVVGNLSSPLFGLSNSTAGGFGGFRGGGPSAAGNRRIELQVRLSF